MELEPGLQRVGVFSRLPQILWELGVDPRDVFDAAGITGAVIDDPNGQITFHQLDRLLSAAVTRSGCRYLTLLVGLQSALRFLGPVGELMRHAPTLRRALLDFAENQHRYVRGSVVYFIDHKEEAVLGYGIHEPGFQNVDQLTDGASAAGSRLVTELCSSAVLEVLLPRAEPLDAEPYRRLLGLPVRFGQEHAGVLLDGALLDRPLKGANPARRAELEGFVKTYWAVHEPSAEQNVRRILRALVLTGEANLDTVAQRIGLHPRTLHRRLIDSGTSFRRILDDVRFGVAQQMLQTTNVSVTQLALWLGYSETAAFSHAFRRWAGISAADWRSKVQSGLSKLPHKASIQPFPGDVRIYQDRNTYPEHKRGEVQRATSQQ